MWLAAFDKAEIESIYYIDGQTKLRRFTFCLQDTGIDNHSCDDVPDGQRGTTVRLVGYKEKYRKQCGKRPETIAAYIIKEFLDIFLGPTCPKIRLHDSTVGQHIDLDTFYEAEMVAHSERKQLTIEDKPFDILHVRLYSTHIPEHRLYLCACHRVVTQEKLAGIPNMAPRFQDNDGREFVYAAYVSSSVLDTAVNADRTGFNLPDDGEELLTDEVSLNDVRKTVREYCREYLSPYTEPVKRKKEQRIRQFIEGDGAMYRPILRHLEHSFDKIEPDATNDDIDRQFYEVSLELQISIRKQGQELLQAVTLEEDNFVAFEDRFNEYFEKVSEVNRADLARYVCHRKAIIEFLRRQLSFQANGKYRNEDRIHSIIFPRGKTSDDVLFEEHNLWLVDERLAFHVFLSSDKPISQAEPLQSESGREPDILVFDKAVAFSETSDAPFSSITIVEFKKPQRTGYGENENPFTQIANYVRDITDGKAKLNDGRSLPIPSNLPFYCYIICDINPSLKRWAENFELETTPDGLGFFGYKRHLRAYCEVISYSKLISDAEKRNQAFFEKLGLPKRMT